MTTPAADQLTFASLFAGIGGIDLGFERAGMRCLWQCEIDAFCRAVLHEHFNVPCYRDIHHIGSDILEPIDVLAGGFPCQPVSQAGRKRAQADPRWLWPEFARLVGELRPAYVVGENVRGLCSRGLEEVLADLASLGYDAEWQVVSAAALGAPHIRERVFIVAYPGSSRRREDAEGAPGDEGADGRGPDEDHEPRRDGAGGRAQDGADADGYGRRARRGQGLRGRQAGEAADPGCSGDGRREDAARLADADGAPRDGSRSAGEPVLREGEVERPGRCGSGLPRIFTEPPTPAWGPEPDVGRVAHGIPRRMDRLRTLGNAVVPQVAEYVGRLIVADAERRGLV